MLTITQGRVFGVPAGLPGLPVWWHHWHLLWYLHHGTHRCLRVGHTYNFCTTCQGNVAEEINWQALPKWAQLMSEKYRYWTVFCILNCWIIGLLNCWIVGVLDCWIVRSDNQVYSSYQWLMYWYIYVKGWNFTRNIRAKQKGIFVGAEKYSCWSYLRATLHNADWCSGVVVQVMEWGSMGWNCLQVMERGLSLLLCTRSTYLSTHLHLPLFSLSCWWLGHRWHCSLFFFSLAFFLLHHHFIFSLSP